MHNKLIKKGDIQVHYNVAGTRRLKYSIEMYHKGLNEHKLITAPEDDILRNKVALQSKKWAVKWDSVDSKRSATVKKEASIEEAKKRTDDAIFLLKQIDNLLTHTVLIDDTVNWEQLKRKDHFTELKPTKPTRVANKEYPPKVYPSMPEKTSPTFIPKFDFIERLFKSKAAKKIKLFEEKYSRAIFDWENEKIVIDKQYENIKSETDKLNEKLAREFDNQINIWKHQLENWEKKHTKFLKEQHEFNAKIDNMKEQYFGLNSDSVNEYNEMVLDNSEYPDSFPKNFELEYNAETKILIVEYQLPSLDCFPKIKEVKYVSSRKELSESYINEAQLNKMFDEAIYKISLRTLHELFEADSANALEAVSFNGWVKSINKATGKEENNCILSIQTKKAEFMTIDLAKVDPKICFKTLKGVASSKLSSLTPIQPILQLSKTDKRFVEGYAVVDRIDNATNLAAMDWEDFEHLIRELFEKEFKTSGGEVKVTQASRDGGVDAVAFDPDPIRGGKIVIQAKRYTNTVGVSAVRDLYGTVMNEGATKGILVSTADFGPDAYEFANGKPLTLLNGSNLLHLLEKHGHHAKIDLREAKQILAEKA